MAKHPGGRPSKQFEYESGIGIVGKFKTEKEYCDFIESTLEEFTEDILGESLVSYKREYSMHGYIFGSKVHTRPPRADFMIKTSNKMALVEAKMYKPTDCYGGIGQLLTYATYNKDEYTDLVLVVPKLPEITLHVIDNFELPIKVVLLTEEKIGIWTRERYQQELQNASR